MSSAHMHGIQTYFMILFLVLSSNYDVLSRCLYQEIPLLTDKGFPHKGQDYYNLTVYKYFIYILH